jgi:ectoine hydroxylase-related dioxygenase (phytanoyl-CoA dioxygenase family)
MTNQLTEEQIETYRRKGYLHLPALFSNEDVEAWDAESRRLLKLGLSREDNLRAVSKPLAPGVAIVDRLNPVIDLSPIFMTLVRDSRITEAVDKLAGEPVLLFKDKLIYKMPGIDGYAMHQDYSMWQTFPAGLINVLVSIDDANADNGGVEFFPGHHHRLLSATGVIRYMNVEEASEIDVDSGEIISTKPGDVVFFSDLTPHRSGPNRSGCMRRQLYLTYSLARHGDLYQQQLEFISERRRKRAGVENRDRVHFE